MSALALVIAIAMPIALVLLGLVMYGRHQQKIQSKRLQANVILNKMNELRDSLEFLLMIDNNKELHLDIMSRIEQLYELYLDILPKKDDDDATPDVSDPDFEGLRRRIEESRELVTCLKSDREIRQAKQHISSILKTLSAMAKRKVISATTMNDYRRYLRILLLEREVDTFIEQGDLAAGREDVITAGNYYKAARKLLIEFDIQYPEKNDRIRDITERSSTLFNGGKPKKDLLTKGLEKEDEKKAEDPYGMDSEEKRTF